MLEGLQDSCKCFFREGIEMETVAGIFKSRAAAEEAVREIHSLGIPNDRIAFLTPGTSDAQAEGAIPTDDAEQPGLLEVDAAVLGAQAAPEVETRLNLAGRFRQQLCETGIAGGGVKRRAP